MKHNWKKGEKNIYLPKEKPELIEVPEYNFFSIKGKGNPNDSFFAEYIAVLYSLSYAVKMSPKQGFAPKNYFEFTVYPLEGVWDIDESAKQNKSGVIDKNALVFNLMMRQPDFVDSAFANEIIARVAKKKPHKLLDSVKFEKICDGKCVQMLHVGSYDDEPMSFERMENYTSEIKLKRIDKTHREIYLSDARKVSPDKLKTVLRFRVE